MARMEERFDQFVDQLSDPMDQLMNRRGNHNVRGTDEEQSKNPFGEDGDSSFEEQLGRRPRRNEREDNRRIHVVATIETDKEEGWKAKDHELEKDAEVGVQIVEDYTTEFYQLFARNDILETEDQLVSQYIGGLRVHIMDSVNMFDPMTLSDA
ncbi:hypothetical protein Tco_0373357 [Tanacetum coccineum]